MGNCKLARYDSFDRHGKAIYSCDEVRHLHKYWKEDFRKRNGTDKVKKDRHYESFCKEIDYFLTNCQCDMDAKLTEYRKERDVTP